MLALGNWTKGCWLIPLPPISFMAARSDEGRNPQSAAAFNTEGSPLETVLKACGLRPEAQHPRQDGNGAGRQSKPDQAYIPSISFNASFAASVNQIRWNRSA